MALKPRNYTSENTSVFLVFLFAVIFTSLNAQNSNECRVLTNQPNETLYGYRISNQVTQQRSLGYSEWEQTQHLQNLDHRIATSHIPIWRRSYEMRLNDFDLNIPDAAYIEGIQLIINGAASAEGRIKDYKIHLLDGSGNFKGDNKARKAIVGDEWPQNGPDTISQWKYGYSTDLWNASWQPSDLNNSNFGVAIQLQNLTSEEAYAYVDQIAIKVWYSAPKYHCGDDCIPYFVEEKTGAVSYNWSLPSGFDNHPDASGRQDVVNLLPAGASYGTHEVCVNIGFEDGATEQCCTKFEYSECLPGCIGNFVWEDLNGDNMQSSGEPGLPNVKVWLFGQDLKFIDESTTDANGNYKFDQVHPGNYYVAVDSITGFFGALTGSGTSDMDSDLYNAFIPNSSGLINIQSGVCNEDIDFGFYRGGTIEGYTWLDLNRNGTRQNDEAFISDTVYLVNNAGQFVDGTITGSTGQYIFEDIKPGSYTVQFTLPDSTFEVTQKQIGTDTQIDSDVALIGNIITTDVINLISGQTMSNIDAGFAYRTGTIMGTLWNDVNANSINDLEFGLDSLLITLYSCDGNLVATTHTDLEGTYAFDTIMAGFDYYLEISIPDHFEVSPLIEDNDFNSDGKSNCFTLLGAGLMDYDAGLIPLNSVGDFVWLDLNRDGIQNADEPGLEAIEIQLQNTNDNTTESTFTDEDGYYDFSDLYPGAYLINLPSIPVELELSLYQAGADENIDSDFLQTNGFLTSDTIHLTGGTFNQSIDAGLLLKTGQITGFVWDDGNGNGQVDSTENVINNLEVGLFLCDGTLVSSTTTNDDGSYLFEDVLALQEYYVHFQKLDGYVFTEVFLITDVTEVNGPGTTNCFELMPNDSLTKVTGQVPLNMVGDYVWLDENNNGLQDPSESGIEGIELVLRDQNDTPYGLTTSDENGFYTFDSLYPRAYYVNVQFIDSLLSLTDYQVIPGDPLSSNFFYDDTVKRTELFELVDGINLDILDAGFVIKEGAITGLAWNDLDGNGKIDTLEGGIEGVEINLFDCQDMLIATTTTQSDGTYIFEDIIAQGEYYIHFGEVDGSILTEVFIETDVTGINGEGTTRCFPVIPFDTTSKISGYVPLNSIGDFVWLDENRNGLQDADEQGIEGVELVLRDKNDTPVGLTMTDANGMYLFDSIYPASYYVNVQFINSDLELTDFQIDPGNPLSSNFYLDDTVSRTEIFNVTGGVEMFDFDAGFTLSVGSVVGRSWYDGNGTGFIEDDEKEYAFLEVQLYSCDGELLETTTTDIDGNYTFENLLPDVEYYIFFELPEEFAYSFAPGDTHMTNGNGIGTTDCFTITAGESENLNVGLAPLATVGDYIWLDENRNGLQDDDEHGIEGITVYIRDIFRVVFDSTTTNENGLYVFEDIYPAIYSLVLPRTDEPMELTTPYIMQGEDISKFMDEDTIIRTWPFNLYNGKQKMSMDGGYVFMDGNIDGFAWSDDNGDGIFDSDETGISNISVSLYSCDGEILDETITNGDGAYSFSEVMPRREYYLTFGGASGFVFSDAGLDHAVSNNFGTGTTDCFMVMEDQTLSQNAGLAPLSTIGDFVFEDLDRNAFQDAGEPGIEGVELQLIDNDGNTIDNQITDQFGNYSFTNVYPGSYNVVLENHPQDMLITALNNMTGGSAFSDQAGVISTAPFTLVGGQDNYDIDAGFVSLSATITGSVFNDANGNSTYDAESYISDIVIELYDCDGALVEATTTNTNGSFIFSDLSPGSYYIYSGLAQNFDYSTAGSGTDISNQNGTGTTDCIDVLVDQVIEINIALAPLSSIGDFIWLDADEDGVQDDMEEGIEDVLINLYDINDDLIDETSSDESGFYSFTNVYPGQYYIQIPKFDSELNITQRQQGNDPEKMSALFEDGANYTSNTFTVENQEDNLNLDAGFITSSLGSAIVEITVWRDNNGDGDNNSTEGPLENVTVTLFNCSGGIAAQGTTDPDGGVSFTGLVDGDMFYVHFDNGSNFTPSNNSTISDITNTYGLGTTDCFTVSDLAPIFLNAGLAPLGTVGDFIWLDENSDGIQDTDEVGISGIEVAVYDDQDQLIAQSVSGQDGSYEVDGIYPGSYYLQLNNIPTNLSLSAYQISSSNQDDNDFLELNENTRTELFLLINGNEFYSIDAGLHLNENIDPDDPLLAGFVWEDMDGNGLIDSETGTNSVRVVLIDEDGIMVDNTETGVSPNGVSGYYSFENLGAGSYYLEFQLDGEAQATQLIASLDQDNSSITEGNGKFTTDVFDYDPSNGITIINGGYFYQGSIGDFVWRDLNQNGIQDPDETGVNDFLVRLFDKENQEIGFAITTNHPMTGTAGYYEFSDLNPNEYYLLANLQPGMFFSEPNQGVDDTFDSDIDQSNGINTSATIDLRSGDAFANFDIGLQLESAIVGSKLWIDLDGDGVQDDDEEGINGVEVRLYTENNTLMETTFTDTDADEGDGHYLFENIQPGNYYVQFMVPDGYLSTVSDLGGDDSKDNDITNMIDEGTTNIFNLDPAESNLDVDGGIYLPSSIGDLVWLDLNQNGIKEDDESGLQSVTVLAIHSIEGIIAETKTDENGWYTFEGLRPGDYSLEFDIPANMMPTLKQVANDPTLDSDTDEFGVTDLLSIQYNSNYDDIDLGVYPLDNSIGDLVWNDIDKDGLQGFEEPGLPDVRVNLLDDNMEIVATQVTNQFGSYKFINIETGDYYLEFEAPDDFIFTLPNANLDIFSDSNVDDEGITEKIFMLPGVFLNDIDAGLYDDNMLTNGQDPKLSLTGKHVDGKNVLSWTDSVPSLDTRFELYRVSNYAPEKQMISLIKNLDVNHDFEYTDIDFAQGGMFDYQLLKKDKEGRLLEKQSVSILVPTIKYSLTKIYPNPAQEYVFVRLIDSEMNLEMDSWQLINSNGALIKSGKGSIESKLDLSELVSGNYILRLKINGQTDIHPLIITD